MPKKKELDVKKAMEKIEKAKYSSSGKLASEIHKDANFFIPEREGYLKRKVNVFYDSLLKVWRIQWNSVYARRLYYGWIFKFSKVKNPNASAYWYLKARSDKLSKWIEFAKKSFKKDYNNLK